MEISVSEDTVMFKIFPDSGKGQESAVTEKEARMWLFEMSTTSQVHNSIYAFADVRNAPLEVAYESK